MAYDGRTLGIALSGGGFRATLFGLGSLWRLNELGLLGGLDRVTGVSGGAILAGFLGARWSHLTFSNGVCTNFEAEIADPIRVFCRRTIDIPSVLKGWVSPLHSGGEIAAGRYDAHLFKGATIRNLPVSPSFVIYATNLQTGRSFRFTRDYMADWHLGINHSDVVPLATAVGASAAFPPVFSPITIKTSPANWRSPGLVSTDLDKLRRKIRLADGGVYDNMGVEALLDNVDIVLVSDAGAPFTAKTSPGTGYIRQLGRVRDILIDQTRALRKRWLVGDLEAGRQAGAYWGITTVIADYQVPTVVADTASTAALQRLGTQLRGFSHAQQAHLINWGYALCDAAVRRRVAPGLDAATKCPVPDFPF